MKLTELQKKYIDSVDGAAHMSAISIIQEAVEAERQRCAKVCEVIKIGAHGRDFKRGCSSCSEAIRRGK